MKYLFLILAITFAFACSNNNKSDKSSLTATINEKEKALMNDQDLSFNPSKANTLILLYSKYANQYPEDTISADYLYKSAELFNAMGNSKMSLEYFERIEKSFPKFSKMPLVVFMQGYVNENTASNFEKAKFHYNRFLKLYPNNKLCSDVKAILENLGKSDKELIESFQKKVQV